MALAVLDAGIVIAVLDAEDGHHESAKLELLRLLNSAQRLVLPASAYAEALVGPLRSGRGDVVDSFVDALPIHVHAADRVICHRAAELRAEHGNRLRLGDALVVATAIELRADELLTTDSRWPDLPLKVNVL